ncbi:hypothetical protein pb186bvf_016204 [Paramecium bursaria]
MHFKNYETTGMQLKCMIMLYELTLILRPFILIKVDKQIYFYRTCTQGFRITLGRYRKIRYSNQDRSQLCNMLLQQRNEKQLYFQMNCIIKSQIVPISN